jgi:hypothetical protein
VVPEKEVEYFDSGKWHINSKFSSIVILPAFSMQFHNEVLHNKMPVICATIFEVALY